MIRLTKINNNLWLKVFNNSKLVYVGGGFESISEAFKTAQYYLK